MTTLAERLPSLALDGLQNLLANARRLEADPGPRAAQAAELIPLIVAELASRAPPPAAPRPRRAKAPAKA